MFPRLLEGEGSSSTRDSHLLWEASLVSLPISCIDPEPVLRPAAKWDTQRTVSPLCTRSGVGPPCPLLCEVQLEGGPSDRTSSDSTGGGGPMAPDFLVTEMVGRSRQNVLSGFRFDSVPV